MISHVWIFVGNNAVNPSGVFQQRELAEEWIAKHGLSGTLTEYPVDTGVYEWAISQGFTPKRPYQSEARFIGRFTSASMRHDHYEDGKNLSEQMIDE